MRVLYSFPQALGAPGIGTTALQQVLGLIKRGHDLTVVAASIHHSCPDLSGARLLRTMVVGGARVPHRVMGQDRTMAYHDLRVARRLRQSPSYDVVHCWPGAALQTARAATAAGLPSVREVPNTHTANAYEVVAQLCQDLGIALPKGHSHSTNLARLKREEAEYDAVSGLLVPSTEVMATFLSRGYPERKLLCHQYGYDPAIFTPSPSPPVDAVHALFLGAVEPRKGLHVALEAWRRTMSRAPYARFTICGGMVESYRPLIADNLKQANVNYRGFVRDTAKILRTANVLVLPSFEEGSALVTYEAQGCGVVPLVSDAAGARCEDGVTGLVHHAGDVDALAAHFSMLQTQPETLARLRSAVLANRANLTWDAAAERLEACYREAVGAFAVAAG
jgi:glycosyltransferase involved in cell wall biosynthesis